MTRRILGTILLGLSATPVFAQTAPAPSEPKRPAYTDRRFDEDWQVLGGDGVTGPADFWDRVKFIPLSKGKHVWLTLNGQIRGREEYVREFQFGQSEPDESDAFGLSRIRLGADLHASRYFRVYVEGKSALVSHRDLTGGDSTTYLDTIDLQNGFVDVMVPLGAKATFTLRGGRQELLFGAQRLVGPSDWTNVRRTFQGVSGTLEAGGWSATPLWTELVVVDQHAFNKASPANKLYGVYATRGGKDAVDLYWLGVDNAAASFNGTSGREQRQTLGGRLSRAAAAARTDFDVEAAAQFGTLGADDIRASMATLNGGYTFDARLKPRTFLTLDFASGDGESGGRVGTFNQLYPTNHTFLGNTDYVGRQNILAPSGGVSVRPTPRLLVTATQFWFWRASVHDGLYNSAGTVLRPGDTSAARYVGAETNLIANYQFDRHTAGYASYNHFFPGSFVRQTGPAQASDYLYAALQYTF